MHHSALPLVAAAAASVVMASPIAQDSPVETRPIKIVMVVADPVPVSAIHPPAAVIRPEDLALATEKSVCPFPLSLLLLPRPCLSNGWPAARPTCRYARRCQRRQGRAV